MNTRNDSYNTSLDIYTYDIMNRHKYSYKLCKILKLSLVSKSLYDMLSVDDTVSIIDSVILEKENIIKENQNILKIII